MNAIHIDNKFLLLAITLIFISACSHRQAETSIKQSAAGIPVTVSALQTGQMATYLDLNATSAFLFKASVKAPVTGYVDNLFINQGDAVQKNHLLATIITREGSAIREDSASALKFNGLLNIKASTSGLISSIDHSKGDFVTEGDQLCQIAIQESFVFILDVPFEQAGSVKINTVCDIQLPDSREIKGIIKSRFTSVAGNSQTERMVVKPSRQISLPENLVVKIRILKEAITNASSLPKSGILTDETMQKYWVMRMINDSTAVKVAVSIGITQNDLVQITQPEFKPTDLFLTSGNYGLGDTAYVKVIKTPGHEK